MKSIKSLKLIKSDKVKSTKCYVCPFKDQCSHHIETGFYKMGMLVAKGLNLQENNHVEV